MGRTSPSPAVPVVVAPSAQATVVTDRGLYERRLRAPLFRVLVVLAIVPAVCVLTPFVLWNARLHGSLGRAFFLQRRMGRARRPFTMIKLRTMHAGRVTSFGRFLRNTHLDELPQVWNLLRGEMTLVGPRPEMLSVHDWAMERIPGYARRLRVTPGLTGLAQVTQGYTALGDLAAYREKTRLDLVYASSIGLRSDLAILARTVTWVLQRKGWFGATGPRVD